MIRPRHTPPPWIMDDQSPGHVMSQDGDGIADCFLVYSNIDKRQSLANARLIAHAPEMFALLQSGFASGAFEDAPVFRSDVERLLKEIAAK